MAQLEEGLQWRDVDWSRRKIHLRRSRVRDRTGTPNRLLTKVLEGVLCEKSAGWERERFRDLGGWNGHRPRPTSDVLTGLRSGS
jgi:hypothetical protein